MTSNTIDFRAAIAQAQDAYARLQADPFAEGTDTDREAAATLQREIIHGNWAPRHIRNFRAALDVLQALA